MKTNRKTDFYITNNYRLSLLRVLSLFILTTFCFFPIQADAHQSAIKDRRTLKFAYSPYSLLGVRPIGKRWVTQTGRIDFNSGFSKFFEIGAYTGACLIDAKHKTKENSYYSNIPTIFYGVNTNFHLIPFFIDDKNFKIDAYLAGKLGGFNRLTNEELLPERGHIWDYGVYFGAAYYWGKHLGFYIEIGKGNYTNGRVGLSIKFFK
jgi:hypothetical protein